MFLVDTNIISELARPRPNTGVTKWAETANSVALSVITVEEIYFGLFWKPNLKIQSWFDAFLGQYCEVFPITPEIAKGSAQMRGRLQSKGRSRSQADMLIAATAEHHQLTLVTRNVRDFDDCGLAVLNPFI
jgi:predicted nucleic acid-binding protein